MILEGVESMRDAIDFFFDKGLISPKGLRDYCIWMAIKGRAEGVTKKKAMLDLEARGARGEALGASYSTIYRVYQTLEEH